MTFVLPQSIILFDWDNTLVDSWPKLAAALNKTFEQFNKPVMDLAAIKQWAHHSLRDSFPATFGEEHNLAKDYFYKVFREELAHFEIAPLDGALEMLDYLGQQGCKLSVLSNKRGDILRTEVAQLNWEKYFKNVVGSLDAVEDKPAAAAVEKALEGMGHIGKSIYLVGDSDVDIICAEQNNLIPVLFGDRSAAPNYSHRAKFHIEHWFSFLESNS